MQGLLCGTAFHKTFFRYIHVPGVNRLSTAQPDGECARAQ